MRKHIIILSLFAGLSLMISPGQAHTFEANQPLIETKDYRQIRKEVQVTYQFKQQIKENIYHGEWITGFYYSGYLTKTKVVKDVNKYRVTYVGSLYRS